MTREFHHKVSATSGALHGPHGGPASSAWRSTANPQRAITNFLLIEHRLRVTVHTSSLHQTSDGRIPGGCGTVLRVVPSSPSPGRCAHGFRRRPTTLFLCSFTTPLNHITALCSGTHGRGVCSRERRGPSTCTWGLWWAMGTPIDPGSGAHCTATAWAEGGKGGVSGPRVGRHSSDPGLGLGLGRFAVGPCISADHSPGHQTHQFSGRTCCSRWLAAVQVCGGGLHADKLSTLLCMRCGLLSRNTVGFNPFPLPWASQQPAWHRLGVLWEPSLIHNLRSILYHLFSQADPTQIDSQ